MKVFSFNGYFLLPEKFEGTVGEALQKLATYIKNCEKEGTCKDKKASPTHNSDTLWKDFSLAIDSDYKAVGDANIVVWDEKKKAWKSILPKRKRATKNV
jgi:hypothetical protein